MECYSIILRAQDMSILDVSGTTCVSAAYVQMTPYQIIFFRKVFWYFDAMTGAILGLHLNATQILFTDETVLTG